MAVGPPFGDFSPEEPGPFGDEDEEEAAPEEQARRSPLAQLGICPRGNNKMVY